MPKSPILGGFSTQRSKNAADNAAFNLGVEIIETKDGKVPGFLFGFSGLDLVGNLGSGPWRGVDTLQDTLYGVSGNEVWSLTPNGVSTLCGTIGSQNSPVSMFANNRQLMIVDGVGAWLVPGGYPFTGGTIESGGGLYALNDTITLQASSGNQTSYPVLTVTGVLNNQATAVFLANAGTTYTSAGGVSTSAIQPQPGTGTGLTITITATVGGTITAAAVDAGGVNYATGDTGLIQAGAMNGVYQVTAQSGGVVTAIIILERGTGYSTTTGAATKAATGIPANPGRGLTLNVTASSGPISAITIGNGGFNYVVGAVGTISGGTGDATYLVTAISPNGAVTSFVVTQGGAINDKATTFTQKSTSGSGAGFELTSPTYGAFVGLVPVSLPFDNPMVGAVSDGFGLLVFLGQQVLAASDELDLSTWGALSYGVCDQSPDNCISLAVIHDEAYVLKENNTEVWVDQGLANFSFGPLTGVHMEVGCMAPFSPAIADEELIWLSRNKQGQGVFVKAAAYQVSPIGTQALTNELQTYSNLGDCIAYARQEGGHTYYVATFPEANVTWCYDKTSSELAGFPIWTRMAAFDNGAWNRHWGNCFTPWKGSVTLTSETTSYQAQSVTFAANTQLVTATGLNGLPVSFSSFVFSLWLDIPNTSADRVVFSNQSSSANPGISITIQNSTFGSPQITVECWDASSNPIVTATYDFTTWTAWVNILVSVDTVAQKIQVWANTLVSNVLEETELSDVSLTWASSNPIVASTTQNWRVGTS